MAKLKSTELIEQERLQLWKDYQAYLKVENSEKLKEYLSLKEKVESAPFHQNRKEIESLKFKGSATESLLKEFSKLERNKKLRIYFQVAESNDLQHYQKMVDSGVPTKFEELKKYVESGAYKKELKQFNKNKDSKTAWENTPEYKKYTEYNDLKQSTDLSLYFRFTGSRKYRIYLSIKDSTLLQQFNDVKKEINSDEFKNRKAYLEDTKRYEKTEDFATLKRFESLDKDAEIQLYLKHHDKDSFKFFREWNLVFEDDFNTALDKQVWSHVTPIFQKGPGKPFSIPGQLHAFNNGKNFEEKGSILTLTTRSEKIKGMAWDSTYGFIEKEFDYSTGLIHSLNFFTQEYGFFDIKLKASKVKGVISSISLVDENEQTCIRIITMEGNKAQGGLISTDHNQKMMVPINLTHNLSGYVIVSFKWTPEKLQWKLNDRKMGVITTNVPHMKLGLRIESEVVRPTSKLPHRLDIDWVKCYKRKTSAN
jgi:hypothetical protein